MIKIGDVFGDWVVVRSTYRFNSCGRYWGCMCICGTRREVNSNSLQRGESKSCGCRRARLRPDLSVHNIWLGMRKRCNNPRNPAYLHYGGRGITVCERWSSYAAFLEDMGPRPDDDHTIERLDVNRGYEPDNCVWLPSALQARNRRDTVRITHEGVTLTLADWAEKTGIKYGTLWARYNAGWSTDRLLGCSPRHSNRWHR